MKLTITSKVCTVCKEDKILDEYGKQKGGYLGLRGACKICRNTSGKKYYNSTTDRQKRRSKIYRDSHKIEIASYNKARKETTKIYNQIYYEKNKAQIIKNTTEYYKKRYHNDDLFRLKCLMRSRINSAIRKKGLTKNFKPINYLGCSFEEFYIYLENKFQDGMSWENRSEWHIDHIIPLDSANTFEEIISLNHFSNLQPLWAKDNYSKGTKVMK